MNSPSVSDSAGCALANLPAQKTPSLPDKQTTTEPFGAILQEASGDQQNAGQTAETSQTAATDSDDSKSVSDETEPASDDTASEKGKKKDGDPSLAAALVCFCPPIKIDCNTTQSAKPKSDSSETQDAGTDIPTATPTPGQQTLTATEISTPISGAEMISSQSTAANASAESVAQMVQPKTQADQKDAPRPARASKSSGAVALDRRLFEPVLPETVAIDTTKIANAKTSQPQAPPAQGAPHGTLVAQLENRVKNTEKSAEIAPAIEQKMPTREVLRRTVDDLTRVESFHADKQSHLLVPDFDAAPSETIPVKSLDAAHLIESIRTEVASLRQRGDNTVTVVLKPDSGTQLSVDLSIARDGTIHAVARCERGDFQSLHTQWPQLQESLAAHGIRVADLSNQNNTQQQNHRSAGAFQNFDRGENSRQRDARDVPSFEEQFSASKTKISLTTKPQTQPAKTASATRRWQSWA